MTTHEPPARVVLTGGPGAGKTAVLEVVRQHLCQHVAVLPEAASIVFGGGFPRWDDDVGRRAGQRAIFHVQCELERLVIERGRAALALCDRGIVDGSVYWPGDPESYWREVGVTRAEALARYRTVIHLRTPAEGHGYDHVNPVRTESAREAVALDERLLAAWQGHPRHFVIASAESFLDKLAATLRLLRDEMPACCRDHIAAPPPQREAP
jgi:predicted ATPase